MVTAAVYFHLVLHTPTKYLRETHNSLNINSHKTFFNLWRIYYSQPFIAVLADGNLDALHHCDVKCTSWKLSLSLSLSLSVSLSLYISLSRFLTHSLSLALSLSLSLLYF